MEVTVIRAGMLTTVQDLGRHGWRAAGVPLSGAMDPFALRIANLLVGNPEDAAVLECTLVGPELVFSTDTVVAIGGAAFAAAPSWQPFPVAAGVPLKLGPTLTGSRGYIAIAGGLRIPPVLGSRSTYLRAGLGGFAGRALRDGDVVPAYGQPRRFAEHWRIDPRILPAYSRSPTVRIVSGAQADEFGGRLAKVEYRILAQSDRMGVRLGGPRLVRIGGADELVSSAVAPGTIQVPPDGQPIVLMADAQTIGGYPQAANVVSVDLPLVAQTRPGDRMRFEEIPLTEAQQLLLDRERVIGMLREGLKQKLT